MSESAALEILKHAILLEKRGRSFYQKVAEQSEDEMVKSFFEFMRDEEIEHIRVLTDQFKAFHENGVFKAGAFDENKASEVASNIMNKTVREKISAAGFESAAIGAAISMEERAVKVYSERGRSATDPEEKKLYNWLAEWERQHLNMLLDIDKGLMEEIWFDNNFWAT